MTVLFCEFLVYVHDHSCIAKWTNGKIVAAQTFPRRKKLGRSEVAFVFVSVAIYATLCIKDSHTYDVRGFHKVHNILIFVWNVSNL